MKVLIKITLLVLCCTQLHAQRTLDESKGVYVDKQGVMRWVSNNSEAAFFGVNYTVPFAYGYRSHKKLGVDLEKAIELDVYHLSLLGVDAFRVHIWDTEITDVQGNLINNDHLRLYDFLLAELKKRKIKTILTPIAFWGNGYPDQDEKTPGFSNKWQKRAALVNDTAIKAMETYLVQLMKHVNPYTKTTYQNDPDIIAAEINNEPHHSGPKEKVTDYINKMVAAMRNNGWKKPIFYNISESPAYADAVSKANIEGVSFQWYPSGLVKNHTLGGNYLPHVDVYRIPFGDTIPEYRNKARMVYEFDAGDLMGSYMYPAMARSYRTAGFQWATQFAYDPLATAYGNTEYQTHYLNLVYTPSKAIGLLIASKVFHRVPRLKSYGAYPADTLFDAFRVSYKEDLAEMNTPEEFYYTNSTQTKPVDASKLKHIAGVGSSPVVSYTGSGIYFIDKQTDGTWTLEVFPDAIPLSDPFERASPYKEVTRIESRSNTINIKLPGFTRELLVKPGKYILDGNGIRNADEKSFGLFEPYSKEISVSHHPHKQWHLGSKLNIRVKISNLDTSDKVLLDLRGAGGNPVKTMKAGSNNEYYWEESGTMNSPAMLTYRVIIQRANGDHVTFPGNLKGNPWAWHNAYRNEFWETSIVPIESPLQLFNTVKDRNQVIIYNTDWRNNSVQYLPTGSGERMTVKLTMRNPGEQRFMAWQYYLGDKIKGRQFELSMFKDLVVRARGIGPAPVMAKITLITTDARAFSYEMALSENLKEIIIPLSELKQDSLLLLPRPYPGFHPLYFKSSVNTPFDIKEIEKFEISFGRNAFPGTPVSVEIEAIGLRK